MTLRTSPGTRGKPSRRRARALGLGLVATCATTSALAFPGRAHAGTAYQLAVVTVGDADQAAAAEFAGILGEAVTLRSPAAPRDTDGLLRQAGAEWSEPYVVVFDVERSLVRVLRPQDGLVLSRPLNPAVAAASPYAVALAAAELVDLAVTSPLAEAAAAAPPAATERRPVPSRWSLGVVAGGFSIVGLDGELALLQPTVGLELLLDRHRTPWFGVVSVSGTVWGLQRRRIAQGGSTTAATAELERHDIVFAVALGRGVGPAALLLFAEFGFAVSSAAALDDSGLRLDSASRVTGWLGLALALRLDLGLGFFLQAATGLAWAPDFLPFSLEGMPPLEEGDILLRGGLSFGWDST